MDTTTAEMVETLRKLQVEVVGAVVVDGLRRFSIPTKTDAMHAGKILRACRLPRVKVLAPAGGAQMWTVTMGTSCD